jgi:hypothetical protein
LLNSSAYSKQQQGTSDINAKSENASPPIYADLWRRLKPGSLILAAGVDEQDNLDGWWEAIIVRVDDDGFRVRWRDDPNWSRRTMATTRALQRVGDNWLFGSPKDEPRVPIWDDILDPCCFAWNKRIGMPWKIMSIRSIEAYRS